jgi:hypothetical protein
VTLKALKVAILYFLFGLGFAGLFLAINPSISRERLLVGFLSACLVQELLRYEIKSDMRAILQGEEETL